MALLLTALVLSVLIPLTSLGWLAIHCSRFSLAVTLLLATASLCLWAWVSWEFRDGLGPDALESIGIEAWRRFFFLGFWQVAIIWGVFVAVTLGMYKRSQRVAGAV